MTGPFIIASAQQGTDPFTKIQQELDPFTPLSQETDPFTSLVEQVTPARSFSSVFTNAVLQSSILAPLGFGAAALELSTELKEGLLSNFPESPRIRGGIKAITGVMETTAAVLKDPLGMFGGALASVANTFDAAKDAGVKESIKALGKGLIELVEIPFEVIIDAELDFTNSTFVFGAPIPAIGEISDEELEVKTQEVVGEVVGFVTGFSIARRLRRAGRAVNKVEDLGDAANLAVTEVSRSQALKIARNGLNLAIESGLGAGATGIFFGDTPEERFNNAVNFGIAGATIGAAIGTSISVIPFLANKIRGFNPGEALVDDVINRQTGGLLRNMDIDQVSVTAERIVNGELLPEAVAFSLKENTAIVMRDIGSVAKKAANVKKGPNNSLLITAKDALTREQLRDFATHGFFRGQVISYVGKKTRIKRIIGNQAKIEGHEKLIDLDNIKPSSEIEFYTGRGRETIPKFEPEGFDLVREINSEVKALRHSAANDVSQKALAEGYYLEFPLSRGSVELRDVGTKRLVQAFDDVADLNSYLDVTPAGSRSGIPENIRLPTGRGIEIPAGVVPNLNNTFVGRAISAAGLPFLGVERALGRFRFFNTLPRIFSELDRLTGAETIAKYLNPNRRAHRSYINSLNDRMSGIAKLNKAYKKLSLEEKRSIPAALEFATPEDIANRFIVGRKMTGIEQAIARRLSKRNAKEIEIIGRHMLLEMSEKQKLGKRFNLATLDANFPTELAEDLTLVRGFTADKKVNTRAILRLARERTSPRTPVKLSAKTKVIKDRIAKHLDESQQAFGDESEVLYRFTMPRMRRMVEQDVSVIYGRKEAQDILYSIVDDAIIDDAYDAAIAFTRSKIKKSKLGNLFGEGSEGVKEVRGALKALRDQNQKMGSEFSNVFETHLDEIHGTFASAEMTAAEGAVKKTFNKLLGVTGDTVDDLSIALTQLTTIRYIGFRPVLGARDFLTPFLDYYVRFGVNRTRKLIQHTINLDKVGAFRAARRGELQSSLSPILSEIGADIGKPTGIVSKPLGRATGLAFELTGQRVMFDRMKAAVFQEARENTLRQIDRFVRGNIDEAGLSKALKLNTYDESIAIEFTDLIKKGDNQSIRKAVDRLATATSFDANLDYGLFYATPSYRTFLGRSAGQFGQWPIGKLNILNRYISQDAAAATRIGVLFGGMYVASRAVDFDLRAWYFTPLHMMFLGGPLLEEGLRLTRDAAGLDAEAVFQDIKRIITPFPSSAVRDFERLRD